MWEICFDLRVEAARWLDFARSWTSSWVSGSKKCLDFAGNLLVCWTISFSVMAGVAAGPRICVMTDCVCLPDLCTTVPGADVPPIFISRSCFSRARNSACRSALLFSAISFFRLMPGVDDLGLTLEAIRLCPLLLMSCFV